MIEPTQKDANNATKNSASIPVPHAVKECNLKQLLENNHTYVGILNKGNTCYINSIVQFISVAKEFLLNLCSIEIKTKFLLSFLRLISEVKTSDFAVDPSHFLRHLKVLYIKSGDPYFNIFQQQDSAEVLSFILCSLFNISKDLRTFFNFTMCICLNTFRPLPVEISYFHFFT